MFITLFIHLWNFIKDILSLHQQILIYPSPLSDKHIKKRSCFNRKSEPSIKSHRFNQPIHNINEPIYHAYINIIETCFPILP